MVKTPQPLRALPIPRKVAVSQRASNLYRYRVRNPDGSASAWSDRRHNLLMNAGLDGVAQADWAHGFEWFAKGTGNLPVENASGAITFTQVGTALTASAPFFQSTDAGAIFKYGIGTSGAQFTVSAFIDSTHVTLSGADTVPTPTVGTLWYVTQTAMDALQATSKNYVSGSCGSAFDVSTGIWTGTRTILFAAESGTVTIIELGWFNSGSGGVFGATMLGRVVLPGAGVTLTAGQQLEVELQVNVTFSPIAQTAVADVSGGAWDTAGTWLLEFVEIFSGGPGIADVIQANGLSGSSGYLSAGSVTFNGDGGTCMMTGAYAQNATLQNAPGVHATFTVANSLGSYSLGSFITTLVGEFNPASGVGLITVIGLGNTSTLLASQLLTTPTNKDNTHSLTLTWETQIGQILTN
jgi:hypothetical protein